MPVTIKHLIFKNAKMWENVHLKIMKYSSAMKITLTIMLMFILMQNIDKFIRDQHLGTTHCNELFLTSLTNCNNLI